MPSGAAVIRYDGARGVVWYVKYRDATGKQVKERVGSAKDGCTKRQAEKALRVKLVAVEQDGYRKPEPLTLSAFADRFVDEHLPGRNLKTSTLVDYGLTIEKHLKRALGDVELVDLERRPELVEAYVTARLKEGLSPKTVRNHLALLGRMFRVAIRWRLVGSNPVEMVDPPRAEDTEPQVLSEVEIARLLAAYRQLEADAEEEERPWWALARRVVVVAVGTGLRRGELLGLRWGDVSMLDRRLTVRQAWVRNEMTTPKSRTSRRVLDLKEDGFVLAALEEQWRASRYRADESLVFCHPALGTPLDPTKLGRDYLRPALAKAKITKPFRLWHDLRHTALTHNAAVNPQAYVQMRAGHSNGSITERYVHAAQVAFPGAAERAEDRIFSAVGGSVPSSGTKTAAIDSAENAEAASVQASPKLPGLDSNQQPSG
jgi:integrase